MGLALKSPLRLFKVTGVCHMGGPGPGRQPVEIMAGKCRRGAWTDSEVVGTKVIRKLSAFSTNRNLLNHVDIKYYINLKKEMLYQQPYNLGQAVIC